MDLNLVVICKIYIMSMVQGATLADREEGLILESINHFDPNSGVFISDSIYNK